jgi:hypothetical protein
MGGERRYRVPSAFMSAARYKQASGIGTTAVEAARSEEDGQDQDPERGRARTGSDVRERGAGLARPGHDCQLSAALPQVKGSRSRGNARRRRGRGHIHCAAPTSAGLDALRTPTPIRRRGWEA